MANLSIDEQIKLLQRKKEKIALLEKLKDMAGSLKDPSGHKGLAQEVKALVEKFVSRAVEEVSGQSMSVSRKPESAIKTPESVTPQKPKPNVDILEFVRKYGQFANKKVSAKTEKGETIIGIAREIQFPNVMVATENGTYEPVLPETLKLEGK